VAVILQSAQRMKTTRAIALATILSLATTTVGCGYVLYPERRGNNGGYVAGGTLVMDLLWLIPGIVPGVIFLIVDFTSGAMYVRPGQAMIVSPQGNVALKLQDQATAKTLELRVVTADHRVLDEQKVSVGPSVRDREVQLHVGATHEKIFLQILDAEHPTTALQPLVRMM
jgi:hypothetical protein